MDFASRLTNYLKKVYFLYSNKPLAFEYDEVKNRRNQIKHSISFQSAQKLWEDVNAIEEKAGYADELRYYRTGMIEGKIFTAVYTWRGWKVRIISVRRARVKEVLRYGKKKKN